MMPDLFEIHLGLLQGDNNNVCDSFDLHRQAANKILSQQQAVSIPAKIENKIKEKIITTIEKGLKL